MFNLADDFFCYNLADIIRYIKSGQDIHSPHVLCMAYQLLGVK